MFNITRQSIHRQSRVWPYRKKHQEKVWTACATFTYLHSNAWTQYSMDYNPLEDICFGHAWGYMLGTIRRYIHVYIYIFIYTKSIFRCIETVFIIWYTHTWGWSKNTWIYIKYIELLMMPIGPTSLGTWVLKLNKLQTLVRLLWLYLSIG